MKTTLKHTRTVIYSLFILVMATGAFTGCKKDKAVKSANLVGKWHGVKLVDDEDGYVEWAAPSSYIQFNSDGTLSSVDFDGDNVGGGTWSLSGNILTVTSNYDHVTEYAQVIKLTSNELVLHSQEEGTTAYYQR